MEHPSAGGAEEEIREDADPSGAAEDADPAGVVDDEEPLPTPTPEPLGGEEAVMSEDESEGLPEAAADVPAAVPQEALEEAADAAVSGTAAKVSGEVPISPRMTKKQTTTVAKGLISWAAAMDGDDEAGVMIEAVLRIQKRRRSQQARRRAEMELVRRRDSLAEKQARETQGASNGKSNKSTPRGGKGVGKLGTADGSADELRQMLGGTGELNAVAVPKGEGKEKEKEKEKKATAAEDDEDDDLYDDFEDGDDDGDSGGEDVEEEDEEEAIASRQGGAPLAKKGARKAGAAASPIVAGARKPPASTAGQGVAESSALEAATEHELDLLDGDAPPDSDLAFLWKQLVNSRNALVQERRELRQTLARAQEDVVAARTKDVMRIEKLAQTNTFLQVQLKELNGVVAEIVSAKKGHVFAKPTPPTKGRGRGRSPG